MLGSHDPAPPGELAAGLRALRAAEFPQLEAGGLAYLDYTGAALPAASQAVAHDEFLRVALLGNPHSEHAPSRSSTEYVAAAREATLRFLDADPAEYQVVFAANASTAIKLVGESFPFADGQLALSADNHNSVTGMREYARRAGARLTTLPLTSELRLDDPLAHLPEATGGPALFAFPAQSNFSGVRHPLSLIEEAQRRGYRVLLDAAAYVPSSPFSLRRGHPDFVAISFYKIFGFPTGVGALVARRDALDALQRPWFAGGTVDWVSVQHGRHQLRSTVEAFEDGTPNYFGIAALLPGFAFIERVGMARISAHVASLTRLLLDQVQAAAHPDGAPVFRLYGPTTTEARGGTVSFNLLDPAGGVVPFEGVESAARAANVAVRSGCFCNPGASEAAFGFPFEASRRCLDEVSGAGFTPRRFGDCMGGGVAVGAVRASVGIATTAEDVVRAVEVLSRVARDAGAAALR